MENPFMRRALELATLGRGWVSPNPMVGCVIVHDRKGEVDIPFARIIGEGWHQRYGEAHAERNAILSVRPEDTHLLPESTAYVTLEPCSHYGKQPPCADLLIERAVGRVVCCNDDPNPLVAGQGFARLRAAGIQVETGVMNELGRQLNARFFTFFEKKRPYIILKWAETTDGFLGGEGSKPVKVSGNLAHRLVHRWRSEEDGIMVGTNTACNDNPQLNTRLWPGKNPVRIVLDRNLILPADLHLFDGSQPTIVYHQSVNRSLESEPEEHNADTALFPLDYAITPSLNHTLQDLRQRGIQSVLVEGGAALLQSFMDEGVWDEMRVFRSPGLMGKGIKAPVVQGKLVSREQVGKDELSIYQPN
ncbi:MULTISPECIES: bifunctional diaminohydroxyphosphoribosylaminopyrimidine deaminase/5-amino-6-(5-phosphoribosylamino)uracil reductase RibD [unclassified Spirosoma]|uniref:bifunctional diaminohydroxyphosphoribosylaminopyrimidine deaminase/5-amino-6-(5-phosphoribosylamino)uracil reductase RibD n=1 Tax=unclassified Spirosoma TaxID=2621999 RepID=UPI000964F24F|nr:MULTISPECIES: bifunctional diaminohydroxyphosphoribosylaminopyrimidine deaminase/5-amino-6-(5-phosphoribosylamino)uracil reductase RibD [unclassified Spirosoma]MBN8823636.1 bifunctional diaminohydroxyphosphoribosylaminopyrimidine deaminase/5-amino-6-(5-phosphoribosylamino)uracil reductase RibD [Spirosoma sp.]OJW76956.1 MAG: riboflavin biosynthesis protein RibD [Spirosoma sp. 48-14]